MPDQTRISTGESCEFLMQMGNQGLISNRSDIIALLSGELMQLRIEKSLFFKTEYHWDSHYFLLTSIGILKFDASLAPCFIPLNIINRVELLNYSSDARIGA